MTFPADGGIAAIAPPEWHERAVSALSSTVVPLAALLAALGLTMAATAIVANRGALRSRTTLRMVPTDAFDPTPEALRRWGAAVAATRRRRDVLARRASAVRFRLSGPPGGRVALTVTCPRHAVGILEAACPFQVELEPVGESSPCEDFSEGKRSRRGIRRATPRYNRPTSLEAGFSRLETARAELVLTSSRHPLATLELAPDPLAPLVAALGDLAEGEAAEVVLDLSPLSARRRRRDLRSALREARSRPTGRDLAGQLRSAFADDPLSTSASKRASVPPASGLQRMEDRTVVKSRHVRLSPAEPGFSVQVLLCASGPRARELVANLAAGFAPAGDRAAWRRSGSHLGPLHWGGADARSRRASFDWRLRSGWFAPRAENLVGVGEIAGWIKPPSRHCGAANALRSGGLVPPPPAGLPTWTPGVTFGLFPLGEITERSVKRWVGAPLADTKFTIAFGLSGGGKSEMAMVRALSLAHEPDGPMRPGWAFEDPHGDALAKLRRYLVGFADRVDELDVARDDHGTQAGYNALDMTGRTPADVGRVASMMTACFSAGAEWGPTNGRALNLVTQASTALAEIGLLLPPHLQPTIFQIVPLLTDEAWRAEIIKHLSPYSAGFWANRLKTQSGGLEATSPVTNLIDRLHSSRQIAAMLGQSRSTFSFRSAMDAGRIVLICPGAGEDKDQLMHVLFLLGMHMAALSRRDLPEDERRPFRAFVDEFQIGDRGTASDITAAMCQQDRKFGLGIDASLQQPDALTKKTLAAMMTNRSHLFSTAVSQESGKFLSGQMGTDDLGGVFVRLPAYHHVASVTLGKTRSPGFKLRGLSIEEAWGEPAGPEAVASLDQTVDATMRRRPVAEVLAELDSLDGRILEALRSRSGPAPSGTLPPARGRRFAVVEPAPRRVVAG